MVDYAALTEGLVEPGNYGYKAILDHPLKIISGGCLLMDDIRRADPAAYDCMDAAILVVERLRGLGYPAEVWEGRDRAGNWLKHYFAVSDGVTVDRTPLYPTVGADHLRTQAIPADQVDYVKACTSMLFGIGIHPLSLTDGRDGSKCLALFDVCQSITNPANRNTAINGGQYLFAVHYQLEKIVDGFPSRALGIGYYFDMMGLLEMMSAGPGTKDPLSLMEHLVRTGSVIEDMAFLTLTPHDGKVIADVCSPKGNDDLLERAETDLPYMKKLLVNAAESIMHPNMREMGYEDTHLEPFVRSNPFTRSSFSKRPRQMHRVEYKGTGLLGSSGTDQNRDYSVWPENVPHEIDISDFLETYFTHNHETGSVSSPYITLGPIPDSAEPKGISGRPLSANLLVEALSARLAATLGKNKGK